MKILFANWATVADFDCHCDDHGYDNIHDFAFANGQMFVTVDAAIAAANQDYVECCGDEAEAMDEEVNADAIMLTWSEPADRKSTYSRTFEGHDRGGKLQAVMILREFNLADLK